ncbi:uncharacterized protein MONOS_18119 [Monocercomonoides exilis]|uniref:uncharacterized protein n=1 Tax=Monocercomonoides exilis TaxID=2049356 RepID=UPI003559B3E0|nr:hypothetical protein MONOS_18119 [Monocercomonoides exilis]
MNHSMIFLGETSSSLTATNSSFIGATRRNGNGGAISGTICNEAVCAVSECNFSSNACIDSHSRGGSIIVSVKKGGKFLFDSNEVMNSKVDAENGFGGGLHLSFEDLEVNYSMIAISFSGNQAHLGSDAPRSQGDDYLKTMWVINDESDPTISVSMLKYLFVSNDEIVFVDREESSNTAGCGNSNNPCQELAFGFSQMSSAKTTLSILKSADLSQPVHCEGEPLTICGVEEVNSVLKVMNHGCVTLLKGSQAAYLSVSSLNITLQTTAEQCPHDAFIEAAVGKVYFVSCIFGDPEGIEKRCCVWIAKGNGCSISFGNVLVAKLLFQSSCGLAFIRSGSLSIDKSSVDTVSTPSDSLVVCINEADSIINSTNVTACKTSQGSFYKVAGSGSNVVSGHCMLSVCTSANGNGGAVGCELSENGQFTINGAEIACCAVNKDSGRGGGIFMRLNDPHGTFLLEAIDFNQNNGYEGRDMFVGCKSLNQSIDPSNIKVPFYNSESIEIVDIKGKDRTHFSDSVDLAMFLYQRQASRVYVSKSGYDMIGCGAEEYPCFSFKRGSMNINELSFEKELLIDAETYIQEPVDVSSFLISSSASSKANISLRPEIIGNTRNAVLEATQQLTATFISFHFPSSFSSNVDCLIFASDIRFRIINSSFVQSGADPLSFALIRAAGGSVEMNSCNVSAITARFAPFVISSKLDLVDAQFSQIKAPESLRGGAFDVCLAEDYTVSLKTSNLSFCECSRNEGKGGFLYLDCTMSTASQPLKIDTITASSNIAHIGKNIYLESKNLNESVTLASFAFDYYEIMNDANAFAGHDPIIGDADLFMFVVEYKSSKIYVAYAGFDVRRCGSEFEPCRTAWAGIQHLTEESQSPQLLITKKTTIQDAHDVSDQGESDPFLLNSRYLTIKNLLVSVSSGFENSKGGVIVNENGTVEAFQSGFSSEATIGTESHCSFLLMQQGFLRVSQFVVSSCNVGKNIFAVSNNSECTFNEMAISNVNITEACICLANSSSMASINKAVGCVITMGNSSFAGVSRSDNDSCIMESASEGGIVQIRNCSFRECRSRDSERGGVAFLNLGEYSSFAFLSSSIIQSFCSEEYGKGGGTYLLFGGVGDLNFLFQNSTFSGNSAFIGRDVFIECFSLSSQINESQFRMDLRESEYHRSNAIYGIDKTDHASTPFDLMELITMFQNDRIVVSSNFEAGGENSKQCGKINFPCLSIDYGLKHVTYDLLTQVLIDISSSLEAEITLDGISVMSLSKNICDVTVNLINRGESSSCLIDGGYERNKTNDNEHNENYICYWNASLASIVNCSAEIKDSTFANSIKGGVAIFGGNVSIIEGKFEDNDPQIFRYPSIRRNIFCSGNGVLNIESLKGGDGLLPNSSLWILNDGCELLGVPSERLSPFFIPTLEKVESERSAEEISFTMKGTLLLPCNLSFQLIATIDETDSIATYQFCDDGFVSEEEVHSAIDISEIPFIPETAEVSIRILFGSREIPKQTDAFILKNRSESQPIENGNLSKSENEQKSSWTLIVIVMAVVLLLVLIILVIFIVRWRKAKNRTEELEEIVNDNIKKDPKAFEMVTMEMSPEEQWKRDEREAEKKNEEKIKRRVYDTNMEHSESSEHLLSESGSTEYILGRDSDKIPEWMLEKIPLLFEGEDLCPTTSSMSNLVDAMACSSPHEKLIVDLRDSLFMLLHGLNKTKEMPIGTLQEREQTAAQILFWVANLALHSFDEMENELSSLADLSPHIVLFSEHMVICIVMHSDFSSDDSDLSSISSSTIITSSSDISVMSERFTDSPPPSSAFEDENDFKKECMRWKAPELLINKKMGATKESVSFSIGMMLWECLSLQIPFGEYEAETAGQKIKDGQRPNETLINGTSFEATVKRGLSQKAEERPTLIQLKREFIQHFPAGATVLTMSDAIDINESRTAEQSATMQNDDHSF